MDFIKNNLITVLVFAACIVGLVVYQNYFAAPPAPILTSDIAASPDGSDLLSSLSDLRAVTLDSSIFNDTVFVSLVDFGVNIAPQPVGRTNPFAPLSGVISGSSSPVVTPTTVTSGVKKKP